MDITAYREALVDRAAVAFSRDTLDEDAFERLASRIQAAANESELRMLEAELAPLVPAETLSKQPADLGSDKRLASRSKRRRELIEQRELSISMGSLKKRGRWVDALRYVLHISMSTIRLDLLSYAADEEFDLNLDLDLSMSTLHIVVPAHWEVDLAIDSNAASTIREGGRRCEDFDENTDSGTGRILVTGSLSMSTVVIKRRRQGRPKRLFRFFFWRNHD